jgi:hypothetical protein
MLIKVFEAKNGEKNEQDFLKEFAIQEWGKASMTQCGRSLAGSAYPRIAKRNVLGSLQDGPRVLASWYPYPSMVSSHVVPGLVGVPNRIR